MALALEVSKGNGNVPFGVVRYGSEIASRVLRGILQVVGVSCPMAGAVRVEAISYGGVDGAASLP